MGSTFLDNEIAKAKQEKLRLSTRLHELNLSEEKSTKTIQDLRYINTKYEDELNKLKIANEMKTLKKQCSVTEINGEKPAPRSPEAMTILTENLYCMTETNEQVDPLHTRGQEVYKFSFSIIIIMLTIRFNMYSFSADEDASPLFG